MKKIYIISAYTSEWRFRRWAFTNYKHAVDYILSEYNNSDVEECWIEVWKTRKGGGLELDENHPYPKPF